MKERTTHKGLKVAALACAATLGLSAWSATPLAVWNGDFDDATTRNGVALTAGDGNTTVAASITIGASSTGAAFVLPTTYRYTAVVFTVSGLENAAAGDILVSLGAGSSPNLVGVYVKAVDSDTGIITLGGIASGETWSTVTYDGTMANTSGDRTFVITYDCGNSGGSDGDGLHLYEITTGSAVVVYGGANSNGLRYATNMCDTLAIGGGKSTYGSNTSLVSFENLVLTKAAVYTSTTALPISSATAASCTIPKSTVLSDSANTISALNTVAEADTANNYFVNVPTATAVFPVADATAASNLVFPYDSTIAVDGTTLTLTGDMPVKLVSSITTVTGSGVVVIDGSTEFTAFDTACASASIFDSAWTGTAWIKNIGSTYSKTQNSTTFTSVNGTLTNIKNYGVAGSKVKFTNVKAYTPNVATIECPYTLVLEDGSDDGEYAWFNNDGWTGKVVNFAGLEGSGTFYNPDNRFCRVTLTFAESSGFTGSLYMEGMNIALGGALTDTTFSENSAGTIEIVDGNTVTIASGKTWKANHGFVVKGAAILSASENATITGPFIGNGTVKLAKPAQAQSQSFGATNSAWTGTVELAAYADTDGSSNDPIYLKYMGNANSLVVLKGISTTASSGKGPYLAPADSGTVIDTTIRLDGDVTFNTGNDKATQTIKAIAGTGNLSFTYSPGNYHYYYLNDVSGYSGTIACANKCMVYLGLPTAPEVGALIAKVDSTNNKVSTTVLVNGSDAGYRGTLETQNDVYGLYINAAATIGDDSYPTLAAAVDAAEEGDTISVSRSVGGETLNITKNVTIQPASGQTIYWDFDSITISEGKTLTCTSWNKGATVRALSGAGNIVSTGNTLNLTLSGDNYSIGSITAGAGMLLQGYGTINVNGDVSVNGELKFLNADSYSSAAAKLHEGAYTIKLAAKSVACTTLSGYGTVETTDGIAAGGTSTFYGTIAGAGGVTANGTSLTLYGPNSFTGALTVSAGTVNIDSSLSGITPLVHLDATDTESIIKNENDYVTNWVSTVGTSTINFTNETDVGMTVVNDYFGGKPAVLTNKKTLWTRELRGDKGNHPSSFYAVMHIVETPTSVAFWRSASSNRGIGKHGQREGWRKQTNGSNSTSDNIWNNGKYADPAPFLSADQTFSVVGWSRLSSETAQAFGGGGGSLAIGELIAISESAGNPSIETGHRIENYLAQKWGIDNGMQSLVATVPVILANDSTLDLGGLAITVSSISGFGTVQNGVLTVTDDISVAVGDTLVIPYDSIYTLADDGTYADVNETAGTVTITHRAASISVTTGEGDEVVTTVTNYDTVQGAVEAYESGTLTVYESATLALTNEVSISGIVLEDSVEITLTQKPPFTATFDSTTGTLTSTRAVSTFVYIGDEDYDASVGNFKIGDVVASDIPGATDTVQFDTATSIYIGSSDIQYAAFILNADVTVTGAKSKYLRVNSYTGTGKLILGDGGWLAPTATATIGCPLKIDGDDTRFYITSGDNYTTVTGELTGSGTLNLTYWADSSYSGNRFQCVATDFEGIINEIQSNGTVKRNITSFIDTDFSSATVVLSSKTGGKAQCYAEFSFSSSSQVIKFGSLSGGLTSTASTSEGVLNGHATIEIGKLGKNDELTGSWMGGNDGRNPTIRKVGTGTLTTSAENAYAYILNGGTLVVKAGAEPNGISEVKTELTDYTVKSEVTYDTDGDDPTAILYTTYTLVQNVASVTHGETTTGYTTLAAAIAEAESGDTVTLLADVDVSNEGVTFPASTTLTLDLNGYTVTAANTEVGHIQVNGALTITDNSEGAAGKIVSGTSGTYGVVQVAEKDVTGASLTIAGGAIEAYFADETDSEGQHPAYGVVVKGTGTTFTMTGGSITAGYMALMGHGSKASGGTYTISDGTLTSMSDFAAYFPTKGDCAVTISGGTFSGLGGVSARAGAVTITGGTFTATGNGAAPGSAPGTTGLGFMALAVTPNYGNVTVSVSGGTFTSATDVAAVMATTSTYTGTISLTGGTYSTDVSDYCATGYEATEDSGVWTVALAQNTDIDPATGVADLDVASDATEEVAQAAAEAKNVAVASEVSTALTNASVTEQTYQGYFTKTAVYDTENSKWTVVVTLDTDLVATADADALAKLQAAAADANATTFTVAVPVGLYYKIQTFDTLGGDAVDTESGLSTGATLAVDKPTTTDKGFVKVEIGAAEIQ